MIKPVLRWAGGKSSILSGLLPLLPSFEGRYFEPFLGGGAVAWSLARPKACLSDLNPEVINLYSSLRDGEAAILESYKKLALEYEKCPKGFYLDLRKAFNCCVGEAGLERASWFLFLNKTSFNGLWRVNKSGEYNVPFGGRDTAPALDERNLQALSVYLSQPGVVLEVGDFRKFIGLAGSGDLVFLDPPYTPGPSAGFTGYTSLGFTLSDLNDLVEEGKKACARGASIVITNSATQAFFPGYTHVTTERRTCVSGHAFARTKETENVYLLKPS